jgi:hypothetical protein
MSLKPPGRLGKNRTHVRYQLHASERLGTYQEESKRMGGKGEQYRGKDDKVALQVKVRMRKKAVIIPIAKEQP